MIFLECYNDVEMIEFFGYTFPNDFVHASGKSEVLKKLNMEKNGIGIIDEDYNEKHPQMQNYEIYEELFEMKLFKHSNKELY